MMRIQMKKLNFLSILFLLFISCVPQKDVIYLQAERDNKIFNVEHEVVKDRSNIESFDEVYIEVTSTDPEGVNFFERSRRNTFTSNSPEGFSIISYRVDEFGNINLPVIGNVKLAGYTLVEAAAMLEEKLNDYLYQPSVKINFVNKSITVVGYVNRPGRYYYSSDHINILQALGMAGDIQEFGNRKKIMVVREENNRTVKDYIDLTREGVIESPYYYLRSNDIIYVQPLKRRWWGMDTFPYALVLSSVTTFILVLDYVQK